MKKKLILILIILFCLTGCWSYVGLDEITIVMGVAIDKDKEDNYLLSFEIIDLASSNKDEGIKTETVMVKGLTIAEAVKNAKIIVANELCFCNSQIIIISNEIATKDGVDSIVDYFIRNIKVRENSEIIISKEKTARELFKGQGLTNDIISLEMIDIIKKSEEVTLYAYDIQLYSIYNILKGEGKELVLPIFKNIKINDVKTIQLDGMATFKKGKLNRYLSPEETKDFLFIINKAKGGILSLSSKGNNNYDIGIEVQTSTTKVRYSYLNNKLKIFIDIDLKGTVGEIEGKHFLIDVKDIAELEKLTNKSLKQRIIKSIKKVQESEDGDIFGIGEKIYQQEPKLWKKLKKDWDKTFSTLDFEVNCKVNIKNSTFTR